MVSESREAWPSRLSIVEYYTELINQVDIDTESVIMRLNQSSTFNESLNEKLDELNRLRVNLLKHIELVEKENLEKWEKSKKFCLYLKRDEISGYLIEKDTIGLLIIKDGFMPESQIEILKYILLFIKRRINRNDVDQNVALNKDFLDNLFIEQQIRQSNLHKNDHIIHIDNNYQDIASQIVLNKFKFNSIESDTFEHFSNLKSISLADNRISSLDFQFSPLFHLENLNLENNNIHSIRTDSFSNLFNLKRLNLSNNRLVELKQEHFEGLSNLEELDLSENQLKTLGENLFLSLSFLKQLNLEFNRITTIKDQSFNGLSSLEVLDLDSNLNLNSIESNSFDHMPNLRVLKLVSNSLNQINSELLNPLINLEEIHLNISNDSSCRLKSLKILKISSEKGSIIEQMQKFKGLSDLEELYLSSIPTISSQPCLSLGPEKFADYSKNLRLIEMNNIKFNNTHQNFFNNLPHLKKLSILRGSIPNQKDSLGNILGSLISLNKLQLSCISFESENCLMLDYISNEMLSRFENLTELNLSKNGIKFLDENMFSGLKKLALLNISYNCLESLNETHFNGLNNLISLDLAGNKIDFNENFKFPLCLNGLKELNLNGNRIEIIRDGLFENLSSLEKLDLSYNRLRQLNKNTFVRNIYLETLNVHFNMIDNLEQGLFENLENLRKLDLSFNQLGTGYKLAFIDVIGSLKSLNNLSLSRNNLTGIGNLIKRLKNLEKIFLAENKLESFNFEDLLDLKHLAYVNLNLNSILYLNDDVVNYLINKRNVTFEFYRNPFVVGLGFLSVSKIVNMIV